MKYCGIVEVTFRSYISYYHSEKYTLLGYLNPANFDDITRHSNFIVELDKEIERSDDYFIEHHKSDLNSVFPLWVRDCFDEFPFALNKHMGFPVDWEVLI